MKTQRDSVNNAKIQSSRETDLRAEVQELSSKMETGLQETAFYKQRCHERDKELSSVSRKSGISFFEMQVSNVPLIL